MQQKLICVKKAHFFFNNSFIKGDLFFVNGHFCTNRVENIDDFEIIEGKDLVVFDSCIDFGTWISEPGFDYRETLDQTKFAAYLGGFGGLIVTSDNDTPLDNKASIKYVINHKSKTKNIKIFPLSSVSRNGQGKTMADLIENQTAGAIGYYDGNLRMLDDALILQSLDYLKAIDGLLIDFVFNPTYSKQGQVHEGLESIKLGLFGIPEISEISAVQRAIELSRHTSSRLVLHGISSISSINLVKQAKSDGLEIFTSVMAHNLLFTDEKLHNFETNFKVLPPLKEISTNAYLWSALLDGSIDLISTGHKPQEPEKKEREFNFASFGSMGLQYTIPAILSKFSLSEAVQVIQNNFGKNPKKIFNIENQLKSLSIFEKTNEYEVLIDDLISNCRNDMIVTSKLIYKIKENFLF